MGSPNARAETREAEQAVLEIGEVTTGLNLAPFLLPFSLPMTAPGLPPSHRAAPLPIDS